MCSLFSFNLNINLPSKLVSRHLVLCRKYLGGASVFSGFPDKARARHDLSDLPPDAMFVFLSDVWLDQAKVSIAQSGGASSMAPVKAADL